MTPLTMTAPPHVPLEALIRRWRDDPGGTYRTWFLWEERLKNFRSIRRGLGLVVEEIARMLGGSRVTGTAREHASQLVVEAHRAARKPGAKKGRAAART